MGLDQREKLMLYKEIVEKISVGVEKKLKQKEYLKEGLFEVVDQGQSLVGGFSNDSSLVVKCDLPVIVFGDHTKCVKFIDFPFVAGADGVKVLRAKECADAKFLYYYTLLLTKKMIDKGYARHYQFLEKMEVNVPSFDEQKRIVNKIEELFSELDSAVETLKKTKEQLVVYRQSVLKEAFEGRFTEQWRKKQENDCIQKDFGEIYRPTETFKDIAGDENELNLFIPKEWKKVRIGEIFEVCVGGTPRRTEPSYWNGNICWVSSGEVKFRKIYETNECITEKGVLNSSAKVRPKGSVLLAMIGEGKTRGQAAVLEVPAAHNQNTASILVSKTPCSPLYLYYYLVLNYDHTRRVGSGNNQKALNKDRVKALRIPFCSFDEQKQIVFQIESRLSACENIEKTVNETLVQADAMRQSILKKVFEGSL